MTVTVNGEPRGFPDVVTVDGLVTALGWDRRGLAIAVNGEVVPRSLWGDHTVLDGDQIEVLTIAQGG